MSTSGSVFSATLQEITNTKLDELSKGRSSFEHAKTSTLAALDTKADSVQRIMALGDGVKNCFDIKLDKAGKVMTGKTKHKQLEVELSNLDRFLDQAKYDPSVSAKTLDAWEQSLIRHLETQSLKFQYATLYGQLVTEWLSSSKQDETGDGGDVEMGEPFEDVGNAKKLESRMEWEQAVFEPAGIDANALELYLNRLFGANDEEMQDIQAGLKAVQDAVYKFEQQISTPDQFNISSLSWVIRGLRSSDLLSDEKRAVLKDFEGNDVILNEIADVLNMRISALSSWTWNSDEPIQVEMRRKISGIYHIHMDEDVLQAIFLHYIGVKWSVFFKDVFKRFRRKTGVWKSADEEIPKIDKLRLKYYLGSLSSSPCLRMERERIYKSTYFLAHLLKSERQTAETAEGEEEVEYATFAEHPRKRKVNAASTRSRNRAMPSQMARPAVGRPARSNSYFLMQAEVDDDSNDDDHDEEKEIFSDDEDNDKPRNAMTLKQDLLHLLSTDMSINKRLYGQMTAFHTVFQSWNTLLPHETILTILKHFGVSETWLNFFRKFLEAPLRFTDDGNSAAAVRNRRRGTPASHTLSDVFGETTFFCLDLAVNRETCGDVLWRVHDDMWFWSRDHNAAVKAWKKIEEFATVTGTEADPAKTGTVRVSSDVEKPLAIDQSLPEGEIRWGFLRLSPQTGKFEIDQTMVNAHIEELRKQLQGERKSILGFIQTWNSYAATLFTSNFGKAANCFGRDHVDNMLATHQRIQREVFSGMGDDKVSSVAEYLKRELDRRFGICDVPDGFIYFPMQLGGLDLQSPFISLLQIRDEVLESTSTALDAFQEAERKAYDRAKEKFLDCRVKKHQRGGGKRGGGKSDNTHWMPESMQERETFMPFEEYVRHREHFSFQHDSKGTRLHEVFGELMKRPKEKSVDPDDGKMWAALDQLRSHPGLKGITGHWASMDPYWRWVAMMYGPDMVGRFGGLNVVDPGLLPVGMVTLFRERRVQWQG